MANRYVPFGYEITDGKLTIIEREADVVRNIFSLYVQGLSLQTISDRMNMLAISYADDGRAWNKNIIKRMIENKRYAGEQNYPPIIPLDTIETAMRCKDGRYVETDKENKCRQDAYRGKTVCHSCGAIMKRIRAGSNRGNRAYWKCPNPECESNKHVFNEAKLNKIIGSLINELCDDLSNVEYQEEKKYEKNQQIVILTNEMHEAMNDTEADAEEVIRKIMKVASAKFDICTTGNTKEITQNIKKDLAVCPKQDIADGNTVNKIIKSIQITPDKHVWIELVNGKMFERM